MQRLFSSFPYGIAGLALVLFRLCVAVQLVTVSGIASLNPSWLLPVVFLLGFSLALGFATPLAALLDILSLLTFHVDGGSKEQLIFACLYAFVLAVLGPGAYSVDARLYGRREIVVTTITETGPNSDSAPSV